jgi:hypothetical protein
MVYGDVTTYGGCVDGGNHWEFLEEYNVCNNIGDPDVHEILQIQDIICKKSNCDYRQFVKGIRLGHVAHSYYRYSDTHTTGYHHTTFRCSDCYYKYTVSYSCPGNPCLIFDSVRNELYE